MVILDIKKIVTISALAFAVAGCQPGDKEAEEAEVAKKDSQTEVVATPSSDIKEEDKIGYALGAKMATFIRTDIEKYQLPKINKESVAAGFADGLKNETKMTDEEIANQFVAFQQMIQAAQQQEQAVQQAKDAEKAKVVIAEGDAYLAENAKKEGVKTTETGLQYQVITQGAADGAKPVATDEVEVHYHGTFIDGSVFDSSVDRGEPVSFPLNRVIPGWTEGLQLMTVGSKYHFVIPWALAYGANGRPGAIPGHSVLKFDVELIAINPEKAPKTENK